MRQVLDICLPNASSRPNIFLPLPPPLGKILVTPTLYPFLHQLCWKLTVCLEAESTESNLKPVRRNMTISNGIVLLVACLMMLHCEHCRQTGMPKGIMQEGAHHTLPPDVFIYTTNGFSHPQQPWHVVQNTRCLGWLVVWPKYTEDRSVLEATDCVVIDINKNGS